MLRKSVREIPYQHAYATVLRKVAYAKAGGLDANAH